jgi:hypothetical protein
LEDPAIPEGSLTIVGTGIQAAGQMTIEARTCMEQAGKLLYLVADPVTTRYIERLNATAESLDSSYGPGKDRFVSYVEMVERIMTEVRKGLDVCVAFYGHPGVFVYPSHVAVRLARDEGFDARMLPGVSAEDCLFADLGIDPSLCGCQSFEATDFLLHSRRFDPFSSLILWQVGVIGDLSFQPDGYDTSGLRVLSEYLEPHYGADHPVFIYEASHYPIFDPVIDRVTIGELVEVVATPISTLYVPPKGTAPIDREMLRRLGVDERALHSVEMKLPTPTGRRRETPAESQTPS